MTTEGVTPGHGMLTGSYPVFYYFDHADSAVVLFYDFVCVCVSSVEVGAVDSISWSVSLLLFHVCCGGETSVV